MKKLLICLTNDIIYDRRMLRTIEALSTNYKIEVICRKIHAESANIQSVRLRRINCWLNRGFLFYVEFNLRLLFTLLITKYDVLLAVDYDTIIPAGISRKLKGKKLVFDAHEYFEESVEIVERPRIQRFWKWVGKTFIKYTDTAYTVSDTIASVYSEMHNKVFKTIRNVPELADVPPPFMSSANIILYQGVLNQGRKLEMLIESSKYLGAGFEIWIVGEGDMSEHLKSMAGENVIFYSWVKPDQLQEITIQATIAYNLLETKSKSYYFSLANKFFDYLHAGVPSINNEYPEYAKINERYNCCFTVNIENAEELAKFIKSKIVAKEEMREKRKNAGLATQDLCWQQESKRLIELFENL